MNESRWIECSRRYAMPLAVGLCVLWAAGPTKAEQTDAAAAGTPSARMQRLLEELPGSQQTKGALLPTLNFVSSGLSVTAAALAYPAGFTALPGVLLGASAVNLTAAIFALARDEDVAYWRGQTTLTGASVALMGAGIFYAFLPELWPQGGDISRGFLALMRMMGMTTGILGLALLAIPWLPGFDHPGLIRREYEAQGALSATEARLIRYVEYVRVGRKLMGVVSVIAGTLMLWSAFQAQVPEAPFLPYLFGGAGVLDVGMGLYSFLGQPREEELWRRYREGGDAKSAVSLTVSPFAVTATF